MDKQMADLCIKYMNEFADFHGYRHAKEVKKHIINLLQAESDGRLVVLTTDSGKLCCNCDGKTSHPVKDNVGIAAKYRCPKCGRLWYENEDE